MVGLPVFYPGQRAVVFLSAESEWGLSHPVGFHQGIFPLSKSTTKEISLNVYHRKLFSNVQNTRVQRLLRDMKQAQLKAPSKPTFTVSQLIELVRAQEVSP